MEQSEYERYQKASKQVKEIKGFYGHLTSYVIVLALLIYINLKFTPEYLWFIWTMLGWGIGLLFHGMRVFSWFPFLNKDWEEKKFDSLWKKIRTKINSIKYGKFRRTPLSGSVKKSQKSKRILYAFDCIYRD